MAYFILQQRYVQIFQKGGPLCISAFFQCLLRFEWCISINKDVLKINFIALTKQEIT